MNDTAHDGTMIVAIDGPAGAGKSSVSKKAAKELDFAFLDTGAMYRAVTWRAMYHKIALDNPDALARCAQVMKLEMHESAGDIQVLVDGEDVTDAIRTPEITRNIYKLDQIPGVRKRLVALQRQFGRRRPTVAEGRDIGTVVFPDARCKIYLVASLACRAKRRASELETKGVAVDLTTLTEEIRERDEKSMTRADSPLRRADDAVLLDTSSLSFEEVVARVVTIARERL